eukprot:4631599-Amphidinium_carterae.1
MASELKAASTPPPRKRKRGSDEDSSSVCTPPKVSLGHYDVLGVSRSADSASIRTAYKKHALRTHPDKGGDMEAFLKVMEAFEVLSDQQRRHRYDCQLVTQRCRDGETMCAKGKDNAKRQRGQPSADELTDPLEHTQVEADEKGTYFEARKLFGELLRNPSEEWEGRLGGSSRRTLEVMCSHLQRTKVKSRKGEVRDEADYPRMKDPPEGLPVGWTCVENIYRSGRCKGHTYLRYTSPWGQRGFMSITASQKAHAQWMGQDVESIVPRQHHKKLTSSGASSSKSGQNGGTSSVQKCIYKVPGGTGSAPSYYCLCMYQCFRIRTRCTKSLAEAIDWHIALAGAREAAQLRIRSSACDGPPVPLLESERDE